LVWTAFRTDGRAQWLRLPAVGMRPPPWGESQKRSAILDVGQLDFLSPDLGVNRNSGMKMPMTPNAAKTMLRMPKMITEVGRFLAFGNWSFSNVTKACQ